MSLSAKDKANVKAIWGKILPKSDEIGEQALSRMLVVYPQTKAYFSHWASVAPGSAPVKKHGITIMNQIDECVNNMDNLFGFLSKLSELHATKLRVDPTNFKILAHNLIVVVAAYFPAEFTPEIHLSADKMLTAYPQTKTYFSHWADLSPGSAPVKKHHHRFCTALSSPCITVLPCLATAGLPMMAAGVDRLPKVLKCL
ncbi:unnamed protein product [Coregonus sp. 'balchen']|nr:unnamed protein product [Coregonus sp. 'balchen']